MDNNTNRVFSESEIIAAENMFRVLKYTTCDYWAKALMSDHFVPGGKLLDYVRGYKDRVQKIIEDPEAKPISMEQIEQFREKFYELADEEINKNLADDKVVATLLGKTERVQFEPYTTILDFDFGGWDNDPTGFVAKAMMFAGIEGKMHIGSRYRKTRITLLKDDGSIREGWFKWQPLIAQVR